MSDKRGNHYFALVMAHGEPRMLISRAVTCASAAVIVSEFLMREYGESAWILAIMETSRGAEYISL